MSDFDLSISAPVGRRYLPDLKKHLRKAHHILSPVLRQMSLAIVPDTAIAALHQRFLGIPTPTDVLTFELDHDRRGRVLAGEVVICLDEARRKCSVSGLPIKNELLLYGLHGMLHLSGFDDRTKRGFEAMHRTEDSILTQLGIGPVFDPRPPSRRRLPRSTGAR